MSWRRDFRKRFQLETYGALFVDLEQPVDGQRRDAEHQMGEHFLRTADTDGARAKLIFEPRIGALDGGALFVSLIFSWRHFREGLSRTESWVFGLGPVCG
jgi:hypothetical protein